MSLTERMVDVPTQLPPGAQLEIQLAGAIDRIYACYRLQPVRILMGPVLYDRLWEYAERHADRIPHIDRSLAFSETKHPQVLTFYHSTTPIPVERDVLRTDVAILIDGAQLVAAESW